MQTSESIRVPPSLLLIPSQLCTAEVWRHQINDLSENVNISVADHTQARSMAGIADHILKTAPDTFALAAHGMGGFVAFEMWRQAPQRIRRMALFDTLATADTPAQITRRQGYADLVRTGKFDQVVEERIPILLHPERQDNESLLKIARGMATQTGAAAFLRQQDAIISRPDSRPTLTTITCSTLVVIGQQDAITTLEDAEMIASNIPNARLDVIEECGHLSPLEQPETVTQLLRGWLNS